MGKPLDARDHGSKNASFEASYAGLKYAAGVCLYYDDPFDPTFLHETER